MWDSQDPLFKQIFKPSTVTYVVPYQSKQFWKMIIFQCPKVTLSFRLIFPNRLLSIFEPVVPPSWHNMAQRCHTSQRCIFLRDISIHLLHWNWAKQQTLGNNYHQLLARSMKHKPSDSHEKTKTQSMNLIKSDHRKSIPKILQANNPCFENAPNSNELPMILVTSCSLEPGPLFPRFFSSWVLPGRGVEWECRIELKEMR